MLDSPPHQGDRGGPQRGPPSRWEGAEGGQRLSYEGANEPSPQRRQPPQPLQSLLPQPLQSLLPPPPQPQPLPALQAPPLLPLQSPLQPPQPQPPLQAPPQPAQAADAAVDAGTAWARAVRDLGEQERAMEAYLRGQAADAAADAHAELQAQRVQQAASGGGGGPSIPPAVAPLQQQSAPMQPVRLVSPARVLPHRWLLI